MHCLNPKVYLKRVDTKANVFNSNKRKVSNRTKLERVPTNFDTNKALQNLSNSKAGLLDNEEKPAVLLKSEDEEFEECNSDIPILHEDKTIEIVDDSTLTKSSLHAINHREEAVRIMMNERNKKITDNQEFKEKKKFMKPQQEIEEKKDEVGENEDIGNQLTEQLSSDNANQNDNRNQVENVGELNQNRHQCDSQPTKIEPIDYSRDEKYICVKKA